MQVRAGNALPLAASKTIEDDSATLSAPASPSSDDATLVARCQDGDLSAYEELVIRYQDRLFNTCWRICGHFEDARELTQEAFLRALQSLGSFQRKSSFYTWIFRIAVNLAIGHRRKNKRATTWTLHSDSQDWLETGQTVRLAAGASRREPSDPPAKLAEEERDRMVVAALNELDEDHRAVVVLRDMESFDYNEISQILEIPTGTVKSRLHRARMLLRERLKPVLFEA